jgi:hypothetical protein
VKALFNIHLLISDSTFYEKGRSKKEFSPYLLGLIRGCKSSFFISRFAWLLIKTDFAHNRINDILMLGRINGMHTRGEVLF